MNDHEDPDLGHDPRRLKLVRADDVLDASPSDGDVSVYYQSNGVVVLLRGQIDISHAQELEEAGSYAIRRNASILVDVRHVDLIDSVGISFLVRVAAAMHSHGTSMSLCGPAPYVQEMLEVAGAKPLFTWVQGRDGPDGLPAP